MSRTCWPRHQQHRRGGCRCLALVFLATLLLPTVAAVAGSPAVVGVDGRPFVYAAGGAGIPYNLDPGDLGPIPHAEAAALAAAALAVWTDVPTATASFTPGPLLPQDIDSSNFLPLIFSTAPDGVSPVIFDTDGAILEALFGANSMLLGLSFPEWFEPSSGTILESLAIFNGGFGNLGFPEAEMLAIMVHEFGHFANLSHSTINNQVARLGDHSGPSPFDTFLREMLQGRIETMSPRAFIGGGQATLHPDDEAIFSALYPAAGFPQNLGTISGTIFGPDGRTPLTGVNVIARNIDNPYDDAGSAVSSDFAAGALVPGNPLLGTYSIHGLTPGATYAVYVDALEDGGYNVPRLFPLPGPEEFHSGAGESFEPLGDDPSVYAPITVAAGAPRTGIDIIMNRRLPGPLPLTNNSSLELFLPFPFPFCGFDFNSVFVNSNGNLTFALGDVDRTPSRAEFLSGLPRIAPLWVNLNPALGGEVRFEQTALAFTVRFDEVARPGLGGANTFAVTLSRFPPRIKFDYGSLDTTAGLAGISCGGVFTAGNEKETDLSAARRGRVGAGWSRAAVFEEYSAGDNDLAGRHLSLAVPGRFRDWSESNDSLQQARFVHLPLETTWLFTQILSRDGQQAADVDYFRFHGRRDELLIAETAAANIFMDTIIGLFDVRSGLLLAADDDSGFGVFSRLITPLPADGIYAVAVSTVPDTEFSGASTIPGRYRLSLRTTREEVIPLTDDDSLEISLGGLEFPYQGQVWTSVFVNSNGSLTFGAGDPFPFPSVSRFLNGPPRIALLWDDLDPAAGGLVTVERAPAAVTIRFAAVPEFFTMTALDASATLMADGTVILDYGQTSANDGLVGFTEGEGAADPGSSDLSAALALPLPGTTYELFAPGTLDVGGLSLTARGGGVPLLRRLRPAARRGSLPTPRSLPPDR